MAISRAGGLAPAGTAKKLNAFGSGAMKGAVGGAARTSKGVLVELANPSAEALRVYPVPPACTLRLVKTAMPFTEGVDVVPERLPDPGLAARPRVIVAAGPV